MEGVEGRPSAEDQGKPGKCFRAVAAAINGLDSQHLFKAVLGKDSETPEDVAWAQAHTASSAPAPHLGHIPC